MPDVYVVGALFLDHMARAPDSISGTLRVVCGTRRAGRFDPVTIALNVDQAGTGLFGPIPGTPRPDRHRNAIDRRRTERDAVDRSADDRGIARINGRETLGLGVRRDEERDNDHQHQQQKPESTHEITSSLKETTFCSPTQRTWCASI